jgi:hypothetical protein
LFVLFSIVLNRSGVGKASFWYWIWPDPAGKEVF